jgi:hypothetical protein
MKKRLFILSLILILAASIISIKDISTSKQYAEEDPPKMFTISHIHI